MHTGNKSALPATSIKASTTLPAKLRRYIAICGASHRVVNMGAFIYDDTVRSGYHFKELFSLLS